MSASRRQIGTFIIAMLVIATAPFDRALLCAADRSAVPPATAQDAALVLVKEIYGKEFAEATTSGKKTALAKSLMETAQETNRGTANHYVLLRSAWDLATDAGEVQLALAAAEKIADNFDVDAQKSKVATIKKIGGNLRTRAQYTDLTAVALAAIDEALAADEYAMATELVAMAFDAARKSGDKQIIKQVAARRSDVAEKVKAYQKVAAALATLEEKPTDAEANQIVGEHVAFVNADWERGLAMLALGTNAQLKALAVRELEGAATAEEQFSLGDAWWDLSQSETDLETTPLKRRAGFWYREAGPDQAEGLVRVKINKRLEEIAALGQEPPTAARAAAPQRPPSTKRTKYAPGLVLRTFPQQAVQDGNRYEAYVTPVEFGAPVNRPPKLIATSHYNHDASENSIAFGYLKIPVEGDYIFSTSSGYDRAALFLNAEPVNRFRDGEGKRTTVHLEPGMVPIAIAGWTIFESVRTDWIPPGTTDPVPIATQFLFHDPTQPVPLVVAEPDGIGHLLEPPAKQP